MKQQVAQKMESLLAPHGKMFPQIGHALNAAQEKMILK